MEATLLGLGAIALTARNARNARNARHTRDLLLMASAWLLGVLQPPAPKPIVVTSSFLARRTRDGGPRALGSVDLDRDLPAFDPIWLTADTTERAGRTRTEGPTPPYETVRASGRKR